MNTKEQIKKMERELAELKRQVEREKKRFKEGDWVVINEYTTNPTRITTIDDGHEYPLNITDLRGLMGSWELDETVRLATKAEIETALRKEWDRRCKEAGWDSGGEAEIEAHANESITSPINSKRYTPSYYYPDDRLWSGNGIVYHKGKWATPKPKQSTYLFNQPDWFVEVDEHEVHIGCQSYTKEFIKTMIDALEYVPTHTATEIIEELNRIKL